MGGDEAAGTDLADAANRREKSTTEGAEEEAEE